VTTEWKRSLVLLRDSVLPHFQEIAVIAPSLPCENSTQQVLESISVESDGIRPIPSFDLRCRARVYWLKRRRQWLRDLKPWIAQAQVVHAGLDDIFRPIMFDGFLEAVRQGKPTVFVQDTDIVGQAMETGAGQPLVKRSCLNAYATVYRRLVIAGVRRAWLSLLKGGQLMRLYAPFAHNAKEIQDTSYQSHEIVAGDVVERRIASLDTGRPMRLVYCGRLIPRKGVDRSIQLVAETRARGGDVRLDIIGGGEQLASLQRQVEHLELCSQITFLGSMKYGPKLLEKLASYDALLFTPPVEDTPRMIFDGYAAGLPMIGSDISYNRERAESEGATWLLPLKDVSGWASRLMDLDYGRLRRLTEAAIQAAYDNTAESWYRRRVEWTLEAIQRGGPPAARSARRSKTARGIAPSLAFPMQVFRTPPVDTAREYQGADPTPDATYDRI